MSWDEHLFALFDDLEAQAENAYDLDREVEVADRAQAEYATVTLAARLHGGVGEEVVLHVQGAGIVTGRLGRVAAGWCLVEASTGSWIVRLPAVMSVRGLPPRAVPEEAWPVTAKLGIGSALRRIADGRGAVQLRLLDGSQTEARRVARIGNDFVEVLVGERLEPVLHTFGALAAVQSRD